MKKLLSIVLTLTLLFMTGCTNEKTVLDFDDPSSTKVETNESKTYNNNTAASSEEYSKEYYLTKLLDPYSGTYDDEVYTNNYFKFTFKQPFSWDTADKSAMHRYFFFINEDLTPTTTFSDLTGFIITELKCTNILYPANKLTVLYDGSINNYQSVEDYYDAEIESLINITNDYANLFAPATPTDAILYEFGTHELLVFNSLHGDYTRGIAVTKDDVGFLIFVLYYPDFATTEDTIYYLEKDFELHFYD